MGPEAIVLSVRENGREGSYSFTCPACEDAVEKRADRKIVALLVSAGVDVQRADGGPMDPATLFDQEPEPQMEPLEHHAGGTPISADDVIEFHFLLADDRYIEDFLAAQQ